MADPSKYHDVHPLYALHSRQWDTLRRLYMGGREFHSAGTTYQLAGLVVQAATPGKTGFTSFSGQEHRYLWRHPREKDARYEVRKRASTYENVIRPLVTTIAATVSRACKKCELPPTLEYLSTDVDRAQMDLATFRLQRISWAHVYPHVFSYLQKPQGEGQPSRMHELAAGLRTYVQLITPLDLLDWQWNAQTRLFDWALLRDRRAYERPAPDEGKSAASEDVCYTRLIKPGEWIAYANGEEYERGATGVDFVPLAIQYGLGQDPESAEPLGIDLLSDAADKAIEAFNKESWLTDQEMVQCFNQAQYKPLEGSPPEDFELAVGTGTYIPAEVFSWQAPSVEPMSHLLASIANDKSTIRQLLGVETKGETSQAAKSGVALQLEQSSMSAMFAGYAAAAEAGERAVWRMAAMMEGANPDDVLVEYARDFSALETGARFEQLMVAVDKFEGRAQAEIKKQIFVAVHPDAEPEVLDEVYAAIDAEVEAAEEAKAAARAAMERMGQAPVPEGEEEGESEEPEEPEEEGDMRPKPMPFGKANGQPPA